MTMIFLRSKASAVSAFTPADLFAASEEGAWYEPSTTTCFTDTAGTTAASVGDAVARINDLSGNGNHATQGTAPARPILRQTAGGLYYLEFDGVDDHLRADNISLYAGGSASLFAGINGLSQVDSVLLGEGRSASNNPQYVLALQGTFSAGDLDSFIRDDSNSLILAQSGGPAAFDSTDRVISVIDTGSSVTPRVDGIADTSKSYTRSGTVTLDRFTVGGLTRGTFSLPYEGRIYVLIYRGAASTAGEISDTETYVAGKTGVTL